MTRTEMIEKLFKAGVDTKTALKKKETSELESLMTKLENKEDVSKTEESMKPIPAKTKHETKKELEEEVAVNVHQLGIFVEFIYHVKHEGAKVKIQNLGFGDAYVDTKPVRVGDKSTRIVTGDSAVIEGTKVIYLMAASQPEIKIIEFM